MRVLRPRRAAVHCGVTLLALVVAGCGARTSSGPVVTPARLPADRPTRASLAAADGVRVAAAWFDAAGAGLAHAAAPALPTPLEANLAALLRRRAIDDLWTRAIAAGDGPSVAGSSRIRRLAGADDAPPDRNRDGTNRDETLADELATLAALAGADPLVGDANAFVTPNGATAVLADEAGPRARDDLVGLRTAAHADHGITTERLGHAWYARVRIGTALTYGRHGAAFGADARSGRQGLVLLQQALAIDELLRLELAFDGNALRALPEEEASAVWWPAALAYVPGTVPDRAPEAWLVVDPASDLRGVAALLRAAVELAWLADPDQPDPRLRALFEDTPLAPPGGGEPPPPSVSWNADVRPILHGTAGCLGCHAPPVTNSAFSVATYESTLAGGRWATPAVVPFDADASPLWAILNGPWQPAGRPFPLPRMPNGRPPLGAAELAVVRAWIDGGALRDPPPPPPRPRAGIDVARALIGVVTARHERVDGPFAGLLDVRVGDAPAELVDAAATGALLGSIAAFVAIEPDEPGLAASVARLAHAAVAHLTTDGGDVIAEFDLRAGRATERVATLGARAALAGGLLAVGRVTGDGALTARGRAIATALLAASWNPNARWLDVEPGATAQLLTAGDFAATVELLTELQRAGDPGAHELASAWLAATASAWSFSELDGGGEVLGDGIDDTDANGVPEPRATGVAPLCADALRVGDGAASAPPPVSYARDLLPLFRARCAGCHVDGVARGGYRVDTVALALRAGESGRAPVDPGAPERSLLVDKLLRRPPSVGAQMPLDAPPLDPRDIARVQQWIREGARDR